jgi:hypothetical protein
VSELDPALSEINCLLPSPALQCDAAESDSDADRSSTRASSRTARADSSTRKVRENQSVMTPTSHLHRFMSYHHPSHRCPPPLETRRIYHLLSLSPEDGRMGRADTPQSSRRFTANSSPLEIRPNSPIMSSTCVKVFCIRPALLPSCPPVLLPPCPPAIVLSSLLCPLPLVGLLQSPCVAVGHSRPAWGEGWYPESR